MPVLLLLFGLAAAAFTWNVYRPMGGGSRRGVLSFLAGWLTGELALHHVAWQVLVVGLLVAVGALRSWPGWLGLLIAAAAWGGLVAFFLRSRDAEGIVESALEQGLGDDYRTWRQAETRALLPNSLRWREILLPFPLADPRVERIRDLVYATHGGQRLRLDLFRPSPGASDPAVAAAAAGRGAPILVQVHGGGWVVGSKNEQGLPLMFRMAAHGWLCASIDYRLSPVATFPDHLVDVKAALVWMREHAREWGGDPGFIVLTGGSAGGHLASLAALTPNVSEFQPGFERADTEVQGCVSFYGVYDFTDPEPTRHSQGLRRLLERWVLKARLADERPRFAAASPTCRVGAQAPPFFVVHGDRDTLVPVSEARRFVGALRAGSRQPVVYAEIPGAQHAFEIFRSLRCVLAIDGVERFLFWLRDRYLTAVTRSAGIGDSSEVDMRDAPAALEETACPTST
ncbi:MAG: alpha/beta hydrolase [Deltaproteobacteria bacterium]